MYIHPLLHDVLISSQTGEKKETVPCWSTLALADSLLVFTLSPPLFSFVETNPYPAASRETLQEKKVPESHHQNPDFDGRQADKTQTYLGWCADAPVTGRSGRCSDTLSPTSPTDEIGISVRERMKKGSFGSKGTSVGRTEREWDREKLYYKFKKKTVKFKQRDVRGKKTLIDLLSDMSGELRILSALDVDSFWD